MTLLFPRTDLWKWKEKKCRLSEHTGGYAPSYLTVAKWTNEFKFCRESLDVDLHSGWPKSATTPEFIAKVHKMVMEDRRLKVWEIDEAVGMSSEWVYHILTESEKIIRKIGAAAFDIGP